MIEMAEEHLRSRGLPAAQWSGSKFRYTQNIAEGMWASVCVEIERRGDQWIITRIDRSRRPAPEAETGFKVL